jgi:hypothetical protein
MFDELKNQWGWTGFTTGEVQRCQILAGIMALIYNWWSLYTRLVIRHRPTKAPTSRPLWLYGVAWQTRHANQSRLTIPSNQAQAPQSRQTLATVSQFLQRLKRTAEQLSAVDRWRAVLRFICRDWLRNAPPAPPVGLLATG